LINVRYYRTIWHEFSIHPSWGLRRLIEKNDGREISRDLEPRIRRVITAMVLAASVEDILGPPGWRIHSLSGDRAGTWSISVSGNWRVTFKVLDGDITNLDLEDYH
jgi:proteic killer suppression protein